MPTKSAEKLDTRLGAIALERGFLSRAELESLMERAKSTRDRPGKRTWRSMLGELLVRERYVSASALSELLDEQRKRRGLHGPRAVAEREAPRLESLGEHLAHMRSSRGRELYLLLGRPPAVRISDALRPLGKRPLERAQLERVLGEVFSPEDLAAAGRGESVARSVVVGARRYRATLLGSEQGVSATFRPLALDPKEDALRVPDEVMSLAILKRGLVIIAGSSAPVRASVLARLVDKMNDETRRHVITIERQISYEHPSRLSLVAQREVGPHTRSYESALRASLREDPDVLAIGEIGDAEAIATALLSAETGHLVICSLHASDPTQALRRMIDVQAAAQRGLARATLANTLQAVVVLDTVHGKTGERHLVADVVPGSPAVTRLIREDRLQNLAGLARTVEGGVSRDAHIRSLYEEGKVARIAALECAEECSCLDDDGAGRGE